MTCQLAAVLFAYPVSTEATKQPLGDLAIECLHAIASGLNVTYLTQGLTSVSAR